MRKNVHKQIGNKVGMWLNEVNQGLGGFKTAKTSLNLVHDRVPYLMPKTIRYLGNGYELGKMRLNQVLTVLN